MLICSRDGSRKVPGFVSHVVDTTGAGDSFWGAFVSQLVRADKRLEEFSIDELAECARYGNASRSAEDSDRFLKRARHLRDSQ